MNHSQLQLTPILRATEPWIQLLLDMLSLSRWLKEHIKLRTVFDLLHALHPKPDYHPTPLLFSLMLSSTASYVGLCQTPQSLILLGLKFTRLCMQRNQGQGSTASSKKAGREKWLAPVILRVPEKCDQPSLPHFSEVVQRTNPNGILRPREPFMLS